jgi:hypothetical protein
MHQCGGVTPLGFVRQKVAGVKAREEGHYPGLASERTQGGSASAQVMYACVGWVWRRPVE